ANIAYSRLYGAINASGVAGTDYSTDLTDPNDKAQAVSYSGGMLMAQATTPGLTGNGVDTTATGSLSWGDTTLTGGGSPMVRPVQMPEDLGAVDVAVLNSFVFVLPAQDDKVKGRVYFIEPGETTVNPLNYFTAERSPDGVNGLEVIGDYLWLPGDG